MSVDSLEGSSSYKIDEPDDLELTEIDGALLRDLLEEEDDPDDDEDAEEEPSLEVQKNDNMRTTNEQDFFSLEDSNNTMEENSLFDMMEMMNPTLPSNEAMAYMYIDEMVEFVLAGDTSELYSGVSADSNNSHCCLWQD